MKTLITSLAAAGAILLAAAGMANAATPAQCQAYAQQQAAAYAPGVQGGGALTGGVIGAIAGGLIGNNNNAALPGAIIGGVGGAMVGGAASQAKYNQIYQQAYAMCMNQGVGPAPAPVMPQPVVGPAPGPQAGVYQALNVRTCAATSCPVLGVIQPGSIVSVSGCTASWCQVGIPQGWGWASRKYLYF